MIDKTKEYWTGENADDLNEYLREYIDEDRTEIKNVVCHTCGNDEFIINYADDEDAVEVTCCKCGSSKLLLDSEEYWDECEPQVLECLDCGHKGHNVNVGFVRRSSSEDVKWVYIGERCTKCGLLGSVSDWKIDYGPTTEMENNI